MRRILSQEERLRKNKKNQIIIGLVLIGLMLFSSLAYAFNSGDTKTISPSEKINYNGIEFSKQNSGLWAFSRYDSNFLTYFNANETKEIEMNLNKSLSDYIDKTIYLYGDASGKSEIVRNLREFVKNFQDVCINEDSECPENLPIKNCSNNLIIFNSSSDIENIYQVENCIFIEGKNIVKNSDAFLFKILKIN